MLNKYAPETEEVSNRAYQIDLLYFTSWNSFKDLMEILLNYLVLSDSFWRCLKTLILPY